MARPANPRELPTGTVTFLFTDIEGSTRLLQELGEGYKQALAEHRRLLREAFAANEGVEVDTQGDAFFVAFASAADALRVAATSQVAFAAGPIRVRMGLHTGRPTVTEEGYVGLDVHLGARIAAAGHGGQVLLSEATSELVEPKLTDLGEHRLKDIDGPVRIFQLGEKRFPPLRTISNTNLPRPTNSFVGREGEVQELVALAREGARLLTLFGPGGSGKTRLAVEAAAALVAEFRAGVFWVGLAPLLDPALVSQTIAATLGAKEDLALHIGEREMLLLLDNFEQVVQAAPELPRLLAACPRLHLLVTSRELLRVKGEVAYPVPPLAKPEAIELFCARARVEQDASVAELCRRLDNLPLAIELAAGRATVLTPAQILGRLSRRLDILRGGRDADPRQQTLRATIAWSHDLLGSDEQLLFARLAAFAGGCTFESAEAVCEADLDMMQSLVEKSLLNRTDERFWMLETVREFALERLEKSEDREQIHRRFAEQVLALAEAAQPHLRGPEQQNWFRSLLAEQNNIRAALSWAVQRKEADIALRLTAALEIFWRRRGQYEEAARWLDAVLALEPPPAPGLRARALAAGAHLAFLAGDVAVAERRYEESVPTLRELGDEGGLAEALRGVAELAAELGEEERARAAAGEALELFAKLGDKGAVAGRLEFLGWLALEHGDFRSARDHFERAITTAREAGDQQNVVGITVSVADLELAAGHLDEAERLYRLALRSESGRSSRRAARGSARESVLAYCPLGLAAVAALRGEPEIAGRLWSAGERLAERLGMRLDAASCARYEQAIATLSGQAAERFESGRAAAPELSLDDAISAADLAGPP